MIKKVDLTKVLTLPDLEDARKKLYRHEARRKNPYKEMFYPPAGRTLKNKFSENKINIYKVYERCRAFEFQPYSGVTIKKANGKRRPLLVPDFEDRIVLKAIHKKIVEVIAQKIDASDEIFGLGERFSTKKTQNIIADTNDSIFQEGYTKMLKIDFSNFFSTVDRKSLLHLLQQEYFNKQNEQERVLFDFIKKSLYNEINGDSNFFKGDIKKMNLKEVGIPQGLPYSPILASIYALDMDQLIKRIEGCVAVRYIDDMVILSKTKKGCDEAYRQIKKLSRKKNLFINTSKTERINFNKSNRVTFLGVDLTNTGQLLFPKEKKDRMRKKLSEIKNESHHLQKYINHPYYRNSTYYKTNKVPYIINKKILDSINGSEQYCESFGLHGYSDAINEIKREFLFT